MADGTTLDPGTGGDTIATDDVGGFKYQWVKLVDGTDGSSAVIPGDATNGLKVDVTRVAGNVAVVDGGGSISVDDGGGSLTVDTTAQAADGAALPATGVAIGGTDGSSFQYVRTDANGIVQVQPAAVVAVSDNGGSITVDGTVTANAGTGPFPISDNAGSITVDAPVATPVFTRLSDGTSALTTSSGRLAVDPSGVTSPVSIAATVNTSQTPKASGGLTISRTISAASTNATSIKGSAGQVYTLYLTNTNAAPRYVKLYNKASAPTVGSDTPVLTCLVPGNTAGAGAVVPFDSGVSFSTGIALAITSGVADADTGAVLADEVIAQVFYA